MSATVANSPVATRAGNNKNILSVCVWPGGRRAQRDQLVATWQQLKAPASTLLRAAGVQGKPSFVDFLWGYSVFWCASGRAFRAQGVRAVGAPVRVHSAL